MRVATVDIGTNTVLLLVAERDAFGKLVAVREAATITRLGEGVDVARALKPEAIERTSVCLESYAKLVRTLAVDAISVVGTSAMRDAGGGDVIRAKVRELFGVDARTISGDEEASVTFRGALSGLTLADGDVAVFDIGGGSTEVVLGAIVDGRAGDVGYAHSFDVGSVRMTERHVTSDPPGADELARLRASVRAAFAAVPRPKAGTRVVGIAGTITTLVAVALEMDPYDGARVHGHALSRNTIDALATKLGAMPLAIRKTLPGLEPKRADVIVAGAIIASEVCAALDADEIVVSDRGVRWGLAEALT
jgi:exopolyphosphatase/guanosine-5'-triphosphate,3'-diphosphate pyrophosphatase